MNKRGKTESFHNWPLFYLIGGSELFLDRSELEFEAITSHFARYDSGHGYPIVVKEEIHYEHLDSWEKSPYLNGKEPIAQQTKQNVGNRWLAVELASATQIQLSMGMELNVNEPSYALPREEQ